MLFRKAECIRGFENEEHVRDADLLFPDKHVKRSCTFLEINLDFGF
jgi:hypothetical protein